MMVVVCILKYLEVLEFAIYTWLMGSSTVRCGPVGVSGLLEKVHHCERGL